jgi:hypothetical protein
MKKQNAPRFGTESAAPDNVPASTQGMVRGDSIVNSRQGKIKVAQAKDQPNTSGWNDKAHSGLLGW